MNPNNYLRKNRGKGDSAYRVWRALTRLSRDRWLSPKELKEAATALSICVSYAYRPSMWACLDNGVGMFGLYKGKPLVEKNWDLGVHKSAQAAATINLVNTIEKLSKRPPTLTRDMLLLKAVIIYEDTRHGSKPTCYVRRRKASDSGHNRRTAQRLNAGDNGAGNSSQHESAQ